MLHNVRIGYRVTGGFLVLLILLLVIAMLAMMSMRYISLAAERVFRAEQIRNALLESRLEQQLVMQQPRPDAASITPFVNVIEHTCTQLEIDLQNDDDRTAIHDVAQAVQIYEQSFTAWCEGSQRQFQESESMQTLATRVEDAAENLRNRQKQKLSASRKMLDARVGEAMWKAEMVQELLVKVSNVRMAAGELIADSEGADMEQIEVMINEIIDRCDLLADRMQDEDEEMELELVELDRSEAEGFLATLQRWMQLTAQEPACRAAVEQAVMDWDVCRDAPQQFLDNPKGSSRKIVRETVDDVVEKNGPDSAVAKASQTFRNAFEKWVRVYTDRARAVETVRFNGASFSQDTDLLAAAQRQRLNDIRAERAEMLDASMAVVDDAHRVNYMVSKLVSSQQQYIADLTETRQQQVYSLITQLLQLASSMQERMTSEDEISQTTAVIRALQTYEASFTTWVDLEQQKKDDERVLTDAAYHVESLCRELSTRQTEFMRTALTSSQRHTIIVGVMAGVFGIWCAYVITMGVVRPLRKVTAAARRVAEGLVDDDVNVYSRDEIGQLAAALRAIIKTLHELHDDAETLITSAQYGRFHVRMDGARHAGMFGQIIHGMNMLMDRFVQVIDVVPNPIVIGDCNLRVQFVNRTAREWMGCDTIPDGCWCGGFQIESTVDGLDPVPLQCMNQKEVRRCEQSIQIADVQRYISWNSIPFEDSTGSVAGFMDIITDLTEVYQSLKLAEQRAEEAQAAVRRTAKQAEYQNCEVQQLVENLEHIADGDFQPLPSVADADEDTAAMHDNFLHIHAALTRTVNAVEAMVESSQSLARCGMEGRLDARIDVNGHRGVYRQVVEGMNALLEALSVPLNECRCVLGEAAQGNLTYSMTENYRGSFDDLKQSVNVTLHQLSSALGKVAENSIQVKSQAGQITAASDSTAGGATKQAAALQQISSSMAEIAAQANANSENASHARQVSEGMQQTICSGKKFIDEMVSAMNRINESSTHIARIMKIIDDIAFQTNLLALNAAVEAARAGIHGKGFAVVADEVRNLAGRSAQAARETSEVIASSTQCVKQGISVVNDMSEAFLHIQQGSISTASLINDIARDSIEQANAVRQVNQGLCQLDAVTQQSAAAAEQLAAVAAELNNQSVELDLQIHFFTTASNDTE